MIWARPLAVHHACSVSDCWLVLIKADSDGWLVLVEIGVGGVVDRSWVPGRLYLAWRACCRADLDAGL